jgi:hypothetical protein
MIYPNDGISRAQIKIYVSFLVARGGSFVHIILKSNDKFINEMFVCLVKWAISVNEKETKFRIEGSTLDIEKFKYFILNFPF